MKISVVGNCQAPGLAECIKLMVPEAEVYAAWTTAGPSILTHNCDIVFLQTDSAQVREDPRFWEGVQPSAFNLIPSFTYSGFHPDCIYAKAGAVTIQSPLGDYNSALVLYGWMNGLSPADTKRLFCEAVYAWLGYFDYSPASRKHLVATGMQCEIDMIRLLDQWSKRGCFAHTINHPKLFVLSSIAREALARCGIPMAMSRPEDYIPDWLLESSVWPVYPEIAARLDVPGGYEFKVPKQLAAPDLPAEILDLELFIERSFACYAHYSRDAVSVERFELQRELYHNLEALAVRPRARRSHPYSNLPEHCFWQKSVAAVAAPQLDPVVDPKFRLTPEDKIATAGSCFAQHIAKTLIRADYNYFVAEPAPADMAPDVAGEKGYGLFSARFGNVYSARQLLQLLQRAYSEFSPEDVAWRRADGRFIDPFRPQIEPDGYNDLEGVVSARTEHLAAVRTMFEQSELFVFTIGLTEAWVAASDGAVFPVAPGVVSSVADAGAYRFVNFTVSEIIADLDDFIARLRTVNGRVRLLFTVSPVPLVATYENRHVLVSTTYSKSAIRAAVDEIVRRYDFVDYFPSYEIITGWYNKGAYFEKDLRSVTQEGVDHVMRLFRAHYLQPEPRAASADATHAAALQREIANVSKIICDEELVGRERQIAGDRDAACNPLGDSPAGPATPTGAGRAVRSAAALPLPALLDVAAHPGDAEEFAGRIEKIEVQLSELQGTIATAADTAATMRAEQRLVRERLDALTHGIETWLLPTLAKHSAAITQRRRRLRAIKRGAARVRRLLKRSTATGSDPVVEA